VAVPETVLGSGRYPYRLIASVSAMGHKTPRWNVIEGGLSEAA
jgi:hypothetical protein